MNLGRIRPLSDKKKLNEQSSQDSFREFPLTELTSSDLLYHSTDVESTPAASIFKNLPSFYFFSIILIDTLNIFSFWCLMSISMELIEDNIEEGVIIIFSITWVWLYLSSIIIGAMADSYLGRTTSYLVLLVVYLLGFILLLVSCFLDWQYSIVFIVTGLLMIGTGRGGMNTLTIPLLGDQSFPDSGLALFRMYYWTMNLGIAGGLAVGTIVWKKSENFWPVLTMCSSLSFISLIIFYFCKKNYKDNQTNRNIVSKCLGIVKSALYNKMTAKTTHLDTLAIQPRDWLDWAKVEYESELVDGLRDVLQIGFIFFLFPIYWAIFFEIMNLWITQASQTDLIVSPDATLTSGHVLIFRPLSVVICTPLFHFIMIPLCHKLKFNLRPLTRILIGLSFAVTATLSSLIVQVTIGSQPSIFVQLPQYLLMGSSEVLVASTLIELSYSESPESMKSIVASLYSLTLGIGHLLLLGIKQAFDTIIDHIIRVGVCAALVTLFSVVLFILLRNHRYKKEGNLQSSEWAKDGLVLYGSDSDNDEPSIHH